MVLLMVLFSGMAFAQQKTISGKVTDEAGAAVPGATIIVKGTTIGTVTDIDGKYGIQVNGLGPGYFKTDLTKALVTDPAFTTWLSGRTPAGRWGEVEELAGAAIFLASDASSFVNGHILYVDGGITASL